MKLEDITKFQILGILYFLYSNRIQKQLGNSFEENVPTCIYDIRKDYLSPFPIIVGVFLLEMTSLWSSLFPNSEKETKIYFLKKLLGVIIQSQIKNI